MAFHISVALTGEHIAALHARLDAGGALAAHGSPYALVVSEEADAINEQQGWIAGNVDGHAM